MSSADAGREDATNPVASRAAVARPAAILFICERMNTPKSGTGSCLLPTCHLNNGLDNKWLSPFLPKVRLATFQ